MSWKKVWKKTTRTMRTFYVVIVGIIVVILMLYIAVMVGLQKSIDDTHTVNMIALILGGLSLPGIFDQIHKIFITNDTKKTMTATTVCPRCKHNVDIRLTED